MHVIIPTAGFGARLRPHTYSFPKVLLNVAGKPILAHILDSLIAGGMTSTTIVIGYLGPAIVTFVRETYPKLPVNFVEQPELLGLGHSIWVARENIPSDGTPLFIMLGDTIIDVDFASVFALPTSVIGVQVVPDPRRFGVAEVDTDGVITKLIEKPEHPTTNLAIAGLYLFRNPALLRSCLDELVEKNIRTKNEYQLTNALQLMIQRGERFSTFQVGNWYDCGKPETLLETNRHILDQQTEKNRSFERTIIIEPCCISNTAEIENSVIGPHASIGVGAKIRNAIIRDSIIGDGARVDGVVTEGSIIGNQAIVHGAFRRFNVGDASDIDC